MIEEAFDRARGKRVLFVGERIEDRYVYVEPLYKPSKETIIAVHPVREETFTGGVIAAAMHLKGWCNGRVLSQWLAVQKTRYVQEGFNRKLFEIYENHKVHTVLNSMDLATAVDEADIVIVLDFGHGLIDDQTRAVLYEAKFLAVNAQSNAGNQGFNPVTKYTRADYVCVDYHEARLAVGMQWEPLEMVIERLCERMGTNSVIITEGRQGASWKGGHTPALEGNPVDTMGAGDCFMAYTAPLIWAGLGLADAAFVGCVAAAIKTEIVGHKRHVNSDEVMARVFYELRSRNMQPVRSGGGL